MRVTVSNMPHGNIKTEYSVRFRHDITDGVGLSKTKRKRLPGRRGVTVCEIVPMRSGIPGDVTARGESSPCSWDDTFNKETGRKQALAAAMQSFAKWARPHFWQAYFGRPRGPALSPPAVLINLLGKAAHCSDINNESVRAL